MFNKANSKYKGRTASVASFFKSTTSTQGSNGHKSTSSSTDRASSAKSTKSLQWSNKGFDGADDTDSDSEVIVSTIKVTKETQSSKKIHTTAKSEPTFITIPSPQHNHESESEDDGFVSLKAKPRSSAVSSFGKRTASELDKEDKENANPAEGKRQKSLTSLMASISTQKALRHVSAQDEKFNFAHFDASSRPGWADEISNVGQAKDANSLSAVQLSDEQQSILKCALNGESFFFTGPAGTGKSILLREIIRMLKDTLPPGSVAVTATTGLAALNIQGETLHRWAGVGLAGDESSVLIRKLSKSKNQNWSKCRTLIIDEVSMLDYTFFDKLVEIAQGIGRDKKSPFGGYQLICTGDFYQLPPVHKSGLPPYCFKGKYWSTVFNKQFQLTQVFRQKGDNMFVAMLNRVRIGQVDEHIVSEFRRLERPLTIANGIEPTRLFPLKASGIRENELRLQSLDKVKCIFQSADYISEGSPREKSDVSGALDDLTRFDKQVILKKDAQVMCVKNSSQQSLVNGQKGIILGFATKLIWEKVEELAKFYPDAKEKYYQLFDTTTLGNDINLYKNALPPGDIFRGFAKIRGEIIRVFKDSGNIVKCHSAQADDRNMILPIVKFTGDYIERLLDPEEFNIFNSKGVARGGRIQIPISLSWAMSIHKSQGQTLDGVIVDLGRAFESGQAYVALSRAVSKEGLQVLNFSANKVKVSKEVHDFYASFSRNSL